MNTTEQTIINAIQGELLENVTNHNNYKLLRDILLQFEGKDITARLQKKLPEGWKYSNNMIGPLATDPNGRSHQIWNIPFSGKQAGGFKIQYYDDTNAPYGRGAYERAEKLHEILKNPQPTIDRYVNMLTAFKAMQQAVIELENNDGGYNNPAYYSILKALNSDYKVLNAIPTR